MSWIGAYDTEDTKSIGVVETGFEADLIAVERNPLDEITTVRDPLLVISNGRIALDRLDFGRIRINEGPPALVGLRRSFVKAGHTDAVTSGPSCPLLRRVLALLLSLQPLIHPADDVLEALDAM